MDCIIGSSNTWTAFRVKKALFWLLEYVSCNPIIQTQIFNNTFIIPVCSSLTRGFVTAGVCFTWAYPSSKPKASTTQAAQYCCHVSSILRGNLQHYLLVQARHRACTIPFQPYQSWLRHDFKNKISDIYNIHDIRSNENTWIKLRLLQTASLKLSVIQNALGLWRSP